MSDVMQRTHHKPGCPWLVNPGLYRCTCFPTGAELAAQQKYTEITSLLEIKDKLDELLAILKGNEVWPGLDKRSDNLFALQVTHFAELAESQGKLLARLDAMDAGLHETAMRNHAQMLDGLQVLGKRMDLAFDILGSALSKRPRKKARRR